MLVANNAGIEDSIWHNKNRVSMKCWGRGTQSTRQIVVTCNGNEEESIQHHQYQASGHGGSSKDLKAGSCKAVQCRPT